MIYSVKSSLLGEKIEDMTYLPLKKTKCSYVLISTNKPILAVNYNMIENNFYVVYMTQDKLLKKDNKSMFVKEYIGGKASINDVMQLIYNDKPVLSFMNLLKQKVRAVMVNSKLFPNKYISSIDRYKVNLPSEDVLLKEMPIESIREIKNLTSIINYEYTTNLEFENVKTSPLDREDEIIHNVRDNHKFRINNYDELQQLSIE